MPSTECWPDGRFALAAARSQHGLAMGRSQFAEDVFSRWSNPARIPGCCAGVPCCEFGLGIHRGAVASWVLRPHLNTWTGVKAVRNMGAAAQAMGPTTGPDVPAGDPCRARCHTILTG